MGGILRRSRRFASPALIAFISACSGGSDGVVNPPPPITGSLGVRVSGLPGGAVATITVTGPAFNRTVTATLTEHDSAYAGLTNLVPGSYTVSAPSVTTSDGRYAPTPSTQSVTVIASTTPATAVVTYALATGSLTLTVAGLPTGVNSSVTVTGPGQFSRTIAATSTLNALEPGSYNIVAGDVATTARTSAGISWKERAVSGRGAGNRASGSRSSIIRITRDAPSPAGSSTAGR